MSLLTQQRKDFTSKRRSKKTIFLLDFVISLIGDFFLDRAYASLCLVHPSWNKVLKHQITWRRATWVHDWTKDRWGSMRAIPNELLFSMQGTGVFCFSQQMKSWVSSQVLSVEVSENLKVPVRLWQDRLEEHILFQEKDEPFSHGGIFDMKRLVAMKVLHLNLSTLSHLEVCANVCKWKRLLNDPALVKSGIAFGEHFIGRESEWWSLLISVKDSRHNHCSCRICRPEGQIDTSTRLRKLGSRKPEPSEAS